MLTAIVYQLDYFYRPETHELIIDVRIERVTQRDGSFLWAIRERGHVLCKDGKWEYEGSGASLSEEDYQHFLTQSRFTSADEASQFWHEGNHKSSSEMSLQWERQYTERQLKTLPSIHRRHEDLTKRLEFLTTILGEMEKRPKVENDS